MSVTSQVEVSRLNRPVPVLSAAQIEDRGIEFDTQQEMVYAYEKRNLVFSTRYSTGATLSASGRAVIWLAFKSDRMDMICLAYRFQLTSPPAASLFMARIGITILVAPEVTGV